jgi:hypothetical protein
MDQVADEHAALVGPLGEVVQQHRRGAFAVHARLDHGFVEQAHVTFIDECAGIDGLEAVFADVALLAGQRQFGDFRNFSSSSHSSLTVDGDQVGVGEVAVVVGVFLLALE